DQATLKLKVAELTSALAETQLGLLEMSEELRAKDAEIQRLSQLPIDLSSKLMVRAYYLDAFEDGTPKGEPYCPYCIETKAGMFRLNKTHNSLRMRCPHCKNEYQNAPNYYYEKQQRP